MSDIETVYQEAVRLRDALNQDIALATTRIEHIRTSALANQAAHLVKNLATLRERETFVSDHPVLFAETPSMH